MGEYAEMMLDGTMCQVCGEFMGEAGDGFPRTCAGCRRKSVTRAMSHPGTPKKVACPTCGKKVKTVGLFDHQRDAHGAGSAPKVARDSGHVCGLAGYNGMIDPPCPACKANRTASPPEGRIP